MSEILTARHGAWLATFHGGRLAEVAHDSAPERAVDCFEVSGWEWDKGGPFGSGAEHRSGPVTAEQLAAELATWAEAYGATTLENEVVS